MADISIVARLINGVVRNVDIASNTLVVNDIKVGGASGTILTEAILTNLINLQNGSDFSDGTNAHTHDGRYFTESELGSSGASSGSDLIGDDNTYSNFTPAAATVKGALSGIDTALAGAGTDELVKVSANDTTGKYLEDAVVASDGSNSTNILEISTLNDGGDEDLQIQIDQSKIDHGSIAGLADDDHTQYIRVDGTRAFTGNQSMGSNRLTSLADPTGDQDAATKAYVDSVAAGLDPKESVRAASTADVGGTYAAGNISGLGASLTMDGVSLTTGDRVLLKNQTDPLENGIYVYDGVDELDRAPDQDGSPANEVSGGNFTFVEQGTANADSGWVLQGDGILTLDTDNLVWVQFSGAGQVTAGDGLTKTGNTLDVGAGDGITVAADTVAVSVSDLAGSGLEDDGSNNLRIAASAAGAGLTGGAGSALDVGAGDGITVAADSVAVSVSDLAGTGLEDDGSNNLRISTAAAGDGLQGGGGSALAVDASAIAGTGLEDDGSENLRIATSAYDGDTITGGGGSAAAVQHAPALQNNEVAGEAMPASGVRAVRYGIDTLDTPETAGRVYLADPTELSLVKSGGNQDPFHVIGLMVAASQSAADPVDVVKGGLMTATSHGLTVGQPCWLDSSGALTSTAPTTTGEAVVKIGVPKDANTIDINIQIMGVN